MEFRISTITIKGLIATCFDSEKYRFKVENKNVPESFNVGVGYIAWITFKGIEEYHLLIAIKCVNVVGNIALFEKC